MTVQNIVPEGRGEAQIRRAFMQTQIAIARLSDLCWPIVLDDHSGVALGTGVKAERYFPWAVRIRGWYLFADLVGSITLDLWAALLASYPPTDGNSICGLNEIAISGADYAYDTTLSAWEPRISAGTVLVVNVDSCTTIQRATLHLLLERN